MPETTDIRPLMFSIAYRMLGRVAEAEDVVQEAYLRLQHAMDEGVAIESPKAFLATVTTRLAIDHLRSAQVRRESYVGSWLPEPVIEDKEPAAVRQIELAESLSMAFLLMMKRCRLSNALCFCYAKYSTTATTRFPKSSRKAKTTAAKYSRARNATLKAGSHDSKRRVKSEINWRTAFSRRARMETSTIWSTCWQKTLCFMGMEAAK